MRISKSGLAILLSKLAHFEKPRADMEQYPTDSETAAEMLWEAFMNSDIKGKIVADLGCGTGILGIGALLLGAERVIFVEKDQNALKILRENIELAERLSGIKIFQKAEIICSDIRDANISADCVVQNPPFGVQNRHADRTFLETAFKIAPVIYSIHKEESNNFIKRLTEANSFKIAGHIIIELPIKKSMPHHMKRIYKFKAGIWKLQKEELA
ncbi:MAG: METTL5 family protein [Candidatus Woesearchaeota archaeon]